MTWRATFEALLDEPKPYHLLKVGGLVGTILGMFLLSVVGWYETSTMVGYVAILAAGLLAMHRGTQLEEREADARRRPLDEDTSDHRSRS